MAARRTRPAARAGSPCCRIIWLARERPVRSGKRDGLCAGAWAFRMGRGQEYPDRLSLCRGRSNAFQDLRGRTGRPDAGRNSRKQYACGLGTSAADAHDTGRFRHRGGSRRAGLCSEPRATRRQRHGVQRLRRADVRKMAPIAQGDRPSCRGGGRDLQPGYRAFRPIVQPRDRDRPRPGGDGDACAGAR